MQFVMHKVVKNIFINTNDTYEIYSLLIRMADDAHHSSATPAMQPPEGKSN
jgi:hypothetical protein